uniref:General transcription factor II-I repeat domain-containing protein 2 n=2 Tax=Cacopsylla melanoneura TaxID=428564 RepID=A0A8D8S7P5_9HEMI
MWPAKDFEVARRQLKILMEKTFFSSTNQRIKKKTKKKKKMLKHSLLLKDQVLMFLQEKEALPAETDLLKNESWLCDLAFLVDVTDYLNKLNVKLQGKDSSLPSMFNLIQGFKAKLKLFQVNLEKNNIDHFPKLVEMVKKLETGKPDISDINKYKLKLELLMKNFEGT